LRCQLAPQRIANNAAVLRPELGEKTWQLAEERIIDWDIVFASLTETYLRASSDLAPSASGVLAFLSCTSAVAVRRSAYRLLGKIIKACQMFDLSLDAVVADVLDIVQPASVGLHESITRLVSASGSYAIARLVRAGVVSYFSNTAFEHDVCTAADLSSAPRDGRTFPPFVFEADLHLFFAFHGSLWAGIRLDGPAPARSSARCPSTLRIFNRLRGEFVPCQCDSELYVLYGGRGAADEATIMELTPLPWRDTDHLLGESSDDSLSASVLHHDGVGAGLAGV
jgi:hypothetical protein